MIPVDDHTPIEGDPLDVLLQDADWPAAGSDRTARLQRQWQAVAARQARRRRRVQLAAAIACVAITGAGIGWLVNSAGHNTAGRPAGDAEEQYASSQTPADVPNAGMQQPDTEIDPAARGHDEQASGGMSAGGAYDRLLIAAARRQFTERRKRQRQLSKERRIVHETINHLVKDPAIDPAEAAEALCDRPTVYERQLVGILRKSRGKRRLAAVRLLAQIATRQSYPVLLELVAWPPAHEPATRAVARLGDSMTLARMAQVEPSAELQRELSAALLARGDRASVALHLDLVRDPRTAAAALAAGRRVRAAPVELLFEFLSSRRVARRMAAAQVLGHLGDPAATARLAEMVVHNQGRNEALVALVASPEPRAADFLAAAQQDLTLVGAIRAAQIRVRYLAN